MAGKYFPNWPLGDRKLAGDGTGNPHDRALWYCFAAHGGAKDLREQFAAKKREIEERRRSGELGPLGVDKALKALVVEFDAKLAHLAKLVDSAKSHHESIRTKLTQRESKKSQDADEAVRRAFQEHRVIARFEALDAHQRREAIRLAIEKKDSNFLSALLAEPALLDETSARSVEIALMQSADNGLFAQFEELGGRLNAHGEIDEPQTSPLAVASFVLADTKEWMNEHVGGADARSVLGRAGVALDGAAIMLTPDQAKDPALYRAAKETAATDGKILSIAGGNGATGSITPEGK
jgi:hypothetical protein